MEKRHQWLLERGDPNGATEFLLSDLQDTTRYSSVQMFDDNTINPCMESTYKYIDHLVASVKELHREIQPLVMFHFGGDEVPGAWVNSSICEIFLREHSDVDGVEGLKRYFSYRVANITAAHGLDLGAWWWGLMDRNSNAFERSQMPNANVVGYAGNNVWEWGGANRAYTLANAGFKVYQQLSVCLLKSLIHITPLQSIPPTSVLKFSVFFRLSCAIQAICFSIILTNQIPRREVSIGQGGS